MQCTAQDLLIAVKRNYYVYAKLYIWQKNRGAHRIVSAGGWVVYWRCMQSSVWH